jgi:predicted sulfurtransferase
MILNISAYKFIDLPADSLAERRQALTERAIEMGIKGTILLSPEGINLFLAAPEQVMRDYLTFLMQPPEFADLWCKESFSDNQPFARMLVKIKKEIIVMDIDSIKPAQATAPYLAPETLKQWYEEGRDMVVLDTRNTFEIELGHFDQAVDLSLKKFRDFDQALDQLDPALKDKPIVTYCTGGIRCEKAAQRMKDKGFTNVYQLEGGILNYFEQCGGEHYTGECFVFDYRVALDANLKETRTEQCFDCRMPLTLEDLHSKTQTCPHCGSSVSYPPAIHTADHAAA